MFELLIIAVAFILLFSGLFFLFGGVSMDYGGGFAIFLGLVMIVLCFGILWADSCFWNGPLNAKIANTASYDQMTFKDLTEISTDAKVFANLPPEVIEVALNLAKSDSLASINQGNLTFMSSPPNSTDDMVVIGRDMKTIVFEKQSFDANGYLDITNEKKHDNFLKGEYTVINSKYILTQEERGFIRQLWDADYLMFQDGNLYYRPAKFGAI